MTESKTVLVLCAACMLILCAAARMVVSIEPFSEPELMPISVSEGQLDFGLVPLHGSVIRELVVRNDGDGPLRAQFSVTGSFFSVSPEEMVLHPGVESRVSVVVTAEQPGRLDDELRILFDGEELSPVIIGLAGEAESSSPRPMPGGELQRA